MGERLVPVCVENEGDTPREVEGQLVAQDDPEELRAGHSTAICP